MDNENIKIKWLTEISEYASSVVEENLYTFVTDETTYDIISKIKNKNYELMKEGCPEFIIVLNIDAKGIVHINITSVKLQTGEEVLLEEWMNS